MADLTETTTQKVCTHERRWLDTTVGQYLLAKEQAFYDQAVVDLFGFNAVQMGGARMDLLRNSRIPNRFHAASFSSTKDSKQQLCCEDDFLPFAEMSVDLLLLPHRLEFSERPHQTLREAARVMMPEGHLLISGFNPISTWGIRAGLSKWLYKRSRYPWHGRFIGLPRMKDWLTLLGFEIVSVELGCHIPPFEQASWHRRFAFWDRFSERYCGLLGGVYFIVAKKRVVGMMPIKPAWKKSSLKPALVARPTQSSPTQSSSNQKNYHTKNKRKTNPYDKQ